MTHEKLIIIGSGPAGLTAALYAARADLHPLVLEGTMAGGQLMITTDVENYPGFPDGIMGRELMDQFRKQAERFGARLHQVDVTEVDFSTRPLQLKVGADEYTTDAVIIATGASARWIGVPGEEQLTGKGVSACATCDGFFFRDQELIVVGGGDTAMEEALFLTKFASKVTIVHRRDEFRASKIMATRALEHPKIEVIWNTVVTKIHGEDMVTGATLEDTVSGEKTEMAVDGVFIAIGHKPTTEIVRGSSRSRRERLPDCGARRWHQDLCGRGVRLRRCCRSHLSSGSNRSRNWMYGRHRRRTLAGPQGMTNQ